MNKTTKKILVDLAQIAGLIAAALLVWYVAAVLTDSELIVPDLWTVFRLAFELLGQGAIWLALLSTLARALVAFAISVAVAFGLALLVGVFPRTRCCANAVVTFLRALPTIAVILMMLVVFRSSTVPVVVAFCLCLPAVAPVGSRTFKKIIPNCCPISAVAKVPSKCSVHW